MKYKIIHETSNEKEYREIMDVINHYYIVDEEQSLKQRK